TPNAADGIGPGSYLLIDQTSGDPVDNGPATFICTANFVWNGPNSATYLGAAGHCFLPEGFDGYVKNPDPYVTRVRVCVKDCIFGGQLGAVYRGDFVDLGPVVYARQTLDG